MKPQTQEASSLERRRLATALKNSMLCRDPWREFCMSYGLDRYTDSEFCLQTLKTELGAESFQTLVQQTFTKDEFRKSAMDLFG